MYCGDFALGVTFDHYFTTRRFSTGAPHQLAGTPAVSAYEDNSTTQITAGITLTVDFDSVTGLNHLRIVATSGNGFEAGKSYYLVLTAGTVDSVSVVGEVVGIFTLERGAAFGRLGAPAGASVSADIATIDGIVDTIVARVVGTLAAGTHNPQSGDAYARLGAPAGASVSADVAAVKSDTAATLADTGTDGVVVAAGSKTGYSLSAAGIQAIWDALTTALTTASSIGKLLVDNINATISSRLASASYTAPLDAAGVRTAVGLASANLDTQLSTIDTVADRIEVDTQDIQGRLPSALNNGCIQADVQRVNNVEVIGDGSATPWGPA
jgi:hypothetical protein